MTDDRRKAPCEASNRSAGIRRPAAPSTTARQLGAVPSAGCGWTCRGATAPAAASHRSPSPLLVLGSLWRRRAEILAGLLVDLAHAQLDLAAVVEAEHFDLDLSPSLTTSATLPTRCGASSLICTSPSRDPRKFTKAPKSTTLTTLPL